MSDESKELALGIRYRWQCVTTAPDTRYTFPEAAATSWIRDWKGPAVYRWVVSDIANSSEVGIYVGETSDFAKRLYQYVKPGPSQKTNLRLSQILKQYLAEGYEVRIDILRFSNFSLADRAISNGDLANKSLRCLLENLFTFQYQREGHNVLNAYAAVAAVEEP